MLAVLFGLVPLLIPAQSAQLAGFKGTDVFLIRQAGAACLGYGVMAMVGFRSGVWREVWLASVMALVFNGFAFVASLIALLSGDPIFIGALIGAAALVNTVLAILALQRKGRI